MSLLNSKFDIQSIDNPMALAALGQVLAVDSPPGLDGNGTPIVGTIPPGAIVEMNSTGNAVLAASPDISAAFKKLVFVTLDGNTDFSGRFVEKLTCLHGGFTMLTDQYVTGAYAPRLPVTFGTSVPGKIELMTDRTTQQLFGFVGPAGLDSVNGILQVIAPQGAGL